MIKLKYRQTKIQKRIRRMWDTGKYSVMYNFSEEKQEVSKSNNSVAKGQPFLNLTEVIHPKIQGVGKHRA